MHYKAGQDVARFKTGIYCSKVFLEWSKHEAGVLMKNDKFTIIIKHVERVGDDLFPVNWFKH